MSHIHCAFAFSISRDIEASARELSLSLASKSHEASLTKAEDSSIIQGKRRIVIQPTPVVIDTR